MHIQRLPPLPQTPYKQKEVRNCMCKWTWVTQLTVLSRSRALKYIEQIRCHSGIYNDKYQWAVMYTRTPVVLAMKHLKTRCNVSVQICMTTSFLAAVILAATSFSLLRGHQQLRALNVNGTPFPLQAWTGPWGSRWLRLQNF
jgi:hypothetical protein